MIREDFKIEICTNSAESVEVAIKAGANRIELCSGMPEGGTTPSYGVISCVRGMMDSGLHAIVRPRGGDFLYSALECKVMQRDIEMMNEMGVDGVVFGCLTADGKVDIEKMIPLMNAARGMSVTFHRAFDMCYDPFQALQAIEALGCERILTSGQKATAEEGISLLRGLIAQSKKVIIMPGCGVNAANINRIAEQTGACEFHLSGRSSVGSDMIYRNPNVSMGGAVQIAEYGRDITDLQKVQDAINALVK